MFDLIAGNDARPLREPSFTSKLVAFVAHVLVVSTVVALTLLQATNQLPELRSIRAFVVEAPPPPPPPPPPAPQALAARPKTPAQPAPATGSVAAPVAAPDVIVPEPPTARDESVGGVAGGVEGGVPGGVIGGIVGGIVSMAPPPPPPPAAPPVASAPRPPVRIGGQITAPALLHRVEPVYPDFASFARLSGMVILEAFVNTEGCVESVKILRTRHPLLDKAAADALSQWRYSPLILNGVPASFVLTVTFNFNVQK